LTVDTRVRVGLSSEVMSTGADA